MKLGRYREYAGVLDIPEGTAGDVRLSHKIYPAGQVLHSANLRTTLFGQKGEELTFPQETRWHELSEEGHGVWMTDLPIEQRQTDELVRHATGRVLVGGLGLGYAVAALASKKRVREIVVVERSADVIALTWAATLKAVERFQTKALTSVTVVQADLFDYLKARQPTNKAAPVFTWGLFDVWQQDGETAFHEQVAPLRALAHGIVRQVECWNEDIMRAQLYQGLVMRRMFLEQPAMAEGMPGMVSVDWLCEPHDSIYTDWSVPFWRWYREFGTQVTKETLEFVTGAYARAYGRPEMEHGRRYLALATPKLARVAS